MAIDPVIIRQAELLAAAEVLSAAAACALAYRLDHQRWPWAVEAFGRTHRALIRAELRRAGLTRGGTPHLPSIRAAVAVADAMIGGAA